MKQWWQETCGKWNSWRLIWVNLYGTMQPCVGSHKVTYSERSEVLHQRSCSAAVAPPPQVLPCDRAMWTSPRWICRHACPLRGLARLQKNGDWGMLSTAELTACNGAVASAFPDSPALAALCCLGPWAPGYLKLFKTGFEQNSLTAVNVFHFCYPRVIQRTVLKETN